MVKHNRLIAATVLCVALSSSSCWLVEDQYQTLDPQIVAEIEAAIGQLNKKNMDEWIAAASFATKNDVEAIAKTTEGIVLTLKPPLEEAGTKAGVSLLQSAAANPTPAGLITGLPAAFLIFASILAKRSQIKSAGGAK
jgi:phage protein U